MNLPFHIAKRYLFSKKKQNVINIISMISVIGVSVGTMALVVVLSVFNGFDGLIRSLFGSFDPDLKILPATGKFFVPDSLRFTQIRNMKGIAFYSEVLEENALLKYGNRQRPALVKGVDDVFPLMTDIDSMMVDGNFLLKTPTQNFAVLGYGVAENLGVGLTFTMPIKFYVPRRSANIGTNPLNAFKTETLFPSGYFMIQQDFDSQYVLVPLTFARRLFGYQNEVSAIELMLTKPDLQEGIQKQIQTRLGKDFIVKTRFQLHDLLFKMMQSEKAAIFLILAFILTIASFNVIGSLTMLIIDKKTDIAILTSMGASQKTIQKIFLLEGWLISISGAFIGIFLGVVLCLAQQKYGFIKLQAEGNFIINSYPVDIRAMDIFLIFITVVVIGYLASRYPVRYITKRFLKFN